MCTLRDDFNDAARIRVRSWVNMYAKKHNLVQYKGEQVNKASRTTVDPSYFNLMRSAKIIVTVNPSNWEGDFRFMEAISSGALVFVGEENTFQNHVISSLSKCITLDHMFVPRPHPFLDKKHVIYYDSTNRSDLFFKLNYYRQRIKDARHVAISGYLHGMKYHRTASLIDYVLRSVHYKLNGANGLNKTYLTKESSEYNETGFDMRNIALSAEDSVKMGNWNSNYFSFMK